MSAPASKKDAKPAAAAEAEVVADDSAASSSEETPSTIADANVLSKYKESAKIAGDALALVLKTAAAGISVLDLVKLSDELILERTSKLYANKKGLAKGVAFPTSLSRGNVVGHYAPMDNDKEQPILAEGDVVKIDLGVHIDGFIAQVAQTFAVPAKAGDAASAPLTGRAADAYAACLVAADAALRLLKPGNKNSQVSEIIQKVAAEYRVSPVQGVLSHQLLKGKIDGDKVILNRLDPEQKVEEVEFKENEVYSVDIVMSTGEGKPKELDSRQTTIFKRHGSTTYQLKHKISRAIFSEIQAKYAHMPFSLRWLEDATKARFGIAEAREHELVQPYPVLVEKEGETVAQVKFTVLLSAAGTQRITGPVGGLDLNGSVVQTEKKFKDLSESLQKELKEITAAANVASSSSAAKKKKKKAAGGEAAPAEAK